MKKLCIEKAWNLFGQRRYGTLAIYVFSCLNNWIRSLPIIGFLIVVPLLAMNTQWTLLTSERTNEIYSTYMSDRNWEAHSLIQEYGKKATKNNKIRAGEIKGEKPIQLYATYLRVALLACARTDYMAEYQADANYCEVLKREFRRDPEYYSDY